ncbi:MAG: SGNH/GDSL hydrolase family protein, partial [Anaerolineae bacterium]|nr:SGNH/GDSL hydrolase family protein [Anaerolineae bacterium]
TPQIVEFNAPARGGAPADALNSGSLYVPVRWHIENRNYNQQPVIEQVAMPSDEAISAPVSDLKVWLQREGTLDMRLVPVDGDTIFLRLRVIDTTSNQTLTENLISLPVVKNADQTLFDPVLPPLDAAILDHIKALYKDGQTQGNKPHSFIKVGDSNIAKDSALCNFGWGNDDLGRFADLQPTVDQFKDSFCAESASAGRSFSSVSLLDPMWATSDSCLPNEAPIDCGIREKHPSYAVLYFGVQDVDHALSPDAYHKNLTQILSALTEHGVIPILSTFPTGYTFHNDGSADRLNAIITQIASDQHLPLIDLRGSTSLYPNQGVDVDGFHMSTPPGGKTSFTGNETLYARTLYELRILEVLHQLEQNVG